MCSEFSDHVGWEIFSDHRCDLEGWEHEKKDLRGGGGVLV